MTYQETYQDPFNWNISVVPVFQISYYTPCYYQSICWIDPRGTVFCINDKGQPVKKVTHNPYQHPGDTAQMPKKWKYDEEGRPVIHVRGCTNEWWRICRSFFVVPSTNSFFYKYGIQENPPTPEEVATVIDLAAKDAIALAHVTLLRWFRYLESRRIFDTMRQEEQEEQEKQAK